MIGEKRNIKEKKLDNSSPNVYEMWLGHWVKQNPDKIAPTRDQFYSLLEMFNIVLEEIGVHE